jgi:predicted amidohydrolase
LKISLVQSELHWQDPLSNLKAFDAILADVSLQDSDVIVLPEMFTSGFTMSPAESASEMDGKLLDWMSSWAKDLDANLLGSVVIKEGGKYYNRLLSFLPSGESFYYDKRHLFAFAGEADSYEAGFDRLVYQYKGFNICPLICYDLRFPVWSRNTEDIDLLIYTANWPSTRIEHWKALLKARAIENQCYVAACNRVGTDQNGLEYSGHSSIIDFGGQLLSQKVESAGIVSAELNLDEVREYRNALPFLKERDTFKII